MNEVNAELARMASRLCHDVGKYVARTAHNVAPGGWNAHLAAMLWRDLFDLGGGPASALFEARARPVEALAGCRPALVEARRLFVEIDRQEAAVRAGDEAALACVASLALAVEAALRSLARELSEGSP